MEESVSTPNKLLEFANRYKTHLIAVLVGGAIVGIAVTAWSYHKDQVKIENAAIIYKYSDELNAFDVKQLDSKQLVTKFMELNKAIEGFEGLIPAIIKTADRLMKSGAVLDAVEVLKVGEKDFADTNDYAAYFLLTRLAVAYEDAGQIENAVAVLEKLNGKPIKILDGKVNLDLGRLYIKLGNKEKAKQNLQHVIEKIGHNNFIPVAKIYLSEIK